MSKTSTTIEVQHPTTIVNSSVSHQVKLMIQTALPKSAIKNISFQR